MKALRKTLSMDKGLRPTSQMVSNLAWLKIAKGVYRGLVGLEIEPTITAQWDATASWPFPQVLNLQQEMLLGKENSLDLVAADWSVTTLLAGLDDSELWQVADFGSVYYLTNGQQVFVRNVEDETITEVTYAEFPKLKTLCEFRGQIVGGNAIEAFQDADETFAVWSGIGKTDFMPDWKNEAGWRSMQIGEIHRCGNLQDEAIAFYGDEGIALLHPAGGTFGYRRLSGQGLLSSSSVGFGEGHLAILQDKKLWMLSNEGLSPLGYREYMEKLEPADIRISFDSLRRAFYITDGVTSFIYANNHLTEANTKPTSLALISGSLFAPTKVLGSPELIIETTWQDLNLVGMKSVEFLELGLICNGVVQATSRVSYNLGEKQHLVPWKPVNNSGYCYISGTGNRFTLAVKLISGSIFQLEYVTFGVKLSDNRIQNQLQTISDRSWNVN